MAYRIYLSPPHLDGEERALLLDALDSGWVAPVGPHLDAFEAEVAAVCERSHAVALSSGTAALHLGLLALGVGPGDDVLLPTLTFAATANAVAYLGARPVLVDAEVETANLDVRLVADELERRTRAGQRQPAAIVPVDLYGRCVDHTALAEVAATYGIPVLDDAAEALGATHAGRPAAAYGIAAAVSFNGNKIITTSGGGMLLTDESALADRVRHLATQAREPARHYEHREVGYNHRMSNLLAAVGRGQLARLDAKVARRRAINARYRDLLADLPGLRFPAPDQRGEPTWWLTWLTIDPAVAGTDRDAVIDALQAVGIEARPVWKPMHLQPVYAAAPVVGGAVAAGLFATGLCLPSGSALTDAEVDEVAEVVRGCWQRR
ncbi:MAG: DegT/DnrJ/EryC1/StrS family aminotransferase [Nitriliruptoraceae bacterium]